MSTEDEKYARQSGGATEVSCKLTMMDHQLYSCLFNVNTPSLILELFLC